MKKIAYLRVSTAEQRPDRQIDGLRELSDELHVETLSAVSKHRPIYEMVVASLRPGDQLIVWDLDRAYRSAKDAINALDALHASGVHFHIAKLQLDTTTPTGKFIYIVMSGLAQFERDTLSQRTREGIAAARARGKRIGRPPKMSQAELHEAQRRIKANTETRAAIAADYDIAPWSLARAIKRCQITTQ